MAKKTKESLYSLIKKYAPKKKKPTLYDEIKKYAPKTKKKKPSRLKKWEKEIKSLQPLVEIISDEIRGVTEEWEKDKRKKVLAYRDIDRYVKQGQKRKYETVYNALLNEATKINSQIYKIEQKIKNVYKIKNEKYEGNKRKKGEKLSGSVFVWEGKELNKMVFDPKIKTVNGLSIKKDSDKVISLLEDMKRKMSAYDFIKMYFDENGNARLVLISRDEIEESESEF